VFFLLHRALSRALDMSEEAVIFAVCNRAIELVDSEALASGSFQNAHRSEATGASSSSSSSYSTSFTQLRHWHIHEVLARRSFFVDIYHVHRVGEAEGQQLSSTSFATPRKNSARLVAEHTSGR
jgi:hypothetical protein